MLSIDRRSLLAASAGLPITSTQPPGARRAQGMPHLQLRPTVHTGSERWPLVERMAHHGVPGVAIAVIQAGRATFAQGFGTRVAGERASVGLDTLFSVGSVSKVATAALCLKLVSLGTLDLDTDVNRWLKRWRLPSEPSGRDDPVTLRMLLSHTSGFNIHGFEDYAPAAPLPTLVQTLNGVSPALNKPLARVDRPGLRSRYSGGGYMVIQTVIEDATGEAFDLVAQRFMFEALGMQRSRFVASPDVSIPDIAHAHDRSGQPAAQPRGWQSFPELAASGLWTTAADLSKLIVSLASSYRGPHGFLPQALAADMMTAVTPGFNGLGPRLAGDGEARIFHHAGANDSYKAYIEGNLASGDGLVILTNGANGDVLGDEIRNAISDAFDWPGDWSVKLGPAPVVDFLTDYVGQYRRRDDQDPTLTGFLDTGFSTDMLELVLVDGQLHLKAGNRLRRLAPVDTSTFVMPDGYVPAATMRFQLNRHADRKVKSLRALASKDVLIFDKT
ncbi:serine hydrolase domain-containing protein [Brevundimonas mediterranea]|uniref:CubicO group peptidase (Beta-lactamase class C family) n=1 Tax=Brevundimonas mediterranea TaxID=74329 RepID=A0A7W6A2R9_9CAUL|nr:serine hydrolase domain-containing protein [Brevundimonas mediterranea]MBB3870815.1 CubicO group peptidase (beta-lactamase class C family) [Brevundimonas mediterranea]